MESIYQYENYKKFVISELKKKGRGGYGQMRRLADALGIHSTLVSQVLQGPKEFTPEQAALASIFLGLSADETEYLLLLVQGARAGNLELRSILKRQREVIKERGKQVSARILKKAEVSEEKRAIFYSDWTYSVIRQLLAIPGVWTVEVISQRLGLRPSRVREILQFLGEIGLIVHKGGEYKMGPASTHLNATSPWVRPHHMNWRHKAIEKMSKREEEDLFFSCPMTLSQADAATIREIMLQSIQKTFSKTDPSPSEEIYCLNIDWFKV